MLCTHNLKEKTVRGLHISCSGPTIPKRGSPIPHVGLRGERLEAVAAEPRSTAGGDHKHTKKAVMDNSNCNAACRRYTMSWAFPELAADQNPEGEGLQAPHTYNTRPNNFPPAIQIGHAHRNHPQANATVSPNWGMQRVP